MLRQACPQLALACLTACVRQLDSLTADQLAQAAFISTQTHLRLNIKGADQMKTLVRAGVARAPAMSALSLTQFMYGAVALGNLKPAQLQVCSVFFTDWPGLPNISAFRQLLHSRSMLTHVWQRTCRYSSACRTLHMCYHLHPWVCL